MGTALFFDGRTAADQHVTVEPEMNGLRFSGVQTPERHWSYSGLKAIERHQAGRAFRITHVGEPTARLLFYDDVFVSELLRRAPGLDGGLSLKTAARTAGWVAAIVAVMALCGYLVVQLAPQQLAFMLPDSWRNRVGAQIEASMTQGAELCTAQGGVSALGALAARIAEGYPDLPPLGIQVYKVPVMNAFAMPGERIVITNELIQRASRPEQVAGVLAHEVGHVIRRHSETQLVRATGLQILLSLLTGGSSDTIGNMAGLAAILSYSREAEAEADAIALDIMTGAAIDPMGLKEFFEIILAEEGKSSTGTWGKITSAINTHPGTEERIKKIHPLPDGVIARPVLTDMQWRSLKKICS